MRMVINQISIKMIKTEASWTKFDLRSNRPNVVVVVVAIVIAADHRDE